jgi:hypothetical protein
MIATALAPHVSLNTTRTVVLIGVPDPDGLAGLDPAEARDLAARLLIFADLADKGRAAIAERREFAAALSREEDLVWAATVRDVLDLQLAEQNARFLTRAIELAELEQCGMCGGVVDTDPPVKPCCHRVIGPCCDGSDRDSHDWTCTDYLNSLTKEDFE